MKLGPISCMVCLCLVMTNDVGAASPVPAPPTRPACEAPRDAPAAASPSGITRHTALTVLAITLFCVFVYRSRRLSVLVS